MSRPRLEVVTTKHPGGPEIVRGAIHQDYTSLLYTFSYTERKCLASEGKKERLGLEAPGRDEAPVVLQKSVFSKDNERFTICLREGPRPTRIP
jgi:hypothetical protein